MKRLVLLWALVATFAAGSPAEAQQAAQAPLRQPDVHWVPTPPDVVAAMLKVAKVGKGDVVYDLGAGDGRIVISAVKDFGAARGVGIDIDPQRVKEATAAAKQAGIGDRVRFMNQDLFTTNLGEATVVTLYLLPSLNLKLLPKLKAELKPGTRIVSHAFDMGSEWAPEQTLDVDGRRVYFWTIPKR
jgi:ribosomal protein L11 methylase PrmA